MAFGHADGGGHGIAVGARSEAAGAQALHQDARALGIGVGQNGDEFLAAPAHQHVAAPQSLAQVVGQGPQGLVAFLVAVGVVDGLELVEIEEGDGQGRVAHGRQPELQVQRLATRPPGVGAGQRVDHGAVDQGGDVVKLAHAREHGHAHHQHHQPEHGAVHVHGERLAAHQEAEHREDEGRGGEQRHLEGGQRKDRQAGQDDVGHQGVELGDQQGDAGDGQVLGHLDGDQVEHRRDQQHGHQHGIGLQPGLGDVPRPGQQQEDQARAQAQRGHHRPLRPGEDEPVDDRPQRHHHREDGGHQLNARDDHRRGVAADVGRVAQRHQQVKELAPGDLDGGEQVGGEGAPALLAVAVGIDQVALHLSGSVHRPSPALREFPSSHRAGGYWKNPILTMVKHGKSRLKSIHSSRMLLGQRCAAKA
ncbi:protein of unknown function [Magnetospirillum sp. XM-1]|nr:protein of unknown function [Magnetospirillum sp. XM-1]